MLLRLNHLLEPHAHDGEEVAVSAKVAAVYHHHVLSGCFDDVRARIETLRIVIVGEI